MRRRTFAGGVAAALAGGVLGADPRRATAQGAAAPDAALASELRLRRDEALVLHRKADLSGLRLIKNGQFVPQQPEVARLMVVHVWAIECKPCLDEFPLLRGIADSFRSAPQTRFVFISETADGAKLLDFMAKQKAELPRGEHYQSIDERLRHSLQQRAQPTTLLLAPLGVVRQAFLGSIKLRRSELVDSIERLNRSL